MDMNRNIPIDLDDNEYKMDDHDSETEEMQIRLVEEDDDQVHEIQNQPRTHTRVGAPTSGSGTQSATQDSSLGSVISKYAKACISKVWDYFDIEYIDVNGTKKRMEKCKFCAKLLTATLTGGTRHLKAHSEKCAEKHNRGKDPMQSQLQFNKDGSVSTWTYDSNVARESLDRAEFGPNLVRSGTLALRAVEPGWAFKTALRASLARPDPNFSSGLGCPYLQLQSEQHF
ncbi:Zinc finger, BED-type [Parasponia andersonii]|uniref:Zinc finger, BED-type n=1 Tax=Parasponia andersonii TaxID=3476 RepID=A0A2P5CZF6_PARAD|nr:Zinc finger, BED-type [Parasponia andersonii]